MTHTPRLLRVREQSEFDKALKSVMLEDDAGEFVIAASEGYGYRIAALWNMAERLRLSTEEINTKESLFRAAADILEALEGVLSLIDESSGVAGYHLNGDVATWEELAIREELEVAIKKARGERHCHSEYGSANCKWEPGIDSTPKCPECN